MNKHKIEYTSLTELIKEINNNQHNVIITENNIYQLYYHHIFQWMDHPLLHLSINEKTKSLSSTEEIWQFLLKNNVTKSHTIYIIGGGVLHDTALFACSVFKRGLNCISVPTTLLAMVDASIGGKNAINYQHIKNLIGTIYIPQKHYLCLDFLNTLPENQLLSGWGEIIKIGLVTDENFYHQSIQHLQSNLLPDLSIIQKAIDLKLQIIQNDLYDTHQRQLLNFGHTIAHAIEAFYEEQNLYIPHGWAVAAGMLTEAHISLQLNLLSYEKYQIIKKDLTPLFQPILLHPSHTETLLYKIIYDKKNPPHQLYFTLLRDIGKGTIKIPVSTDIIQSSVHQTLTQHF